MSADRVDVRASGDPVRRIADAVLYEGYVLWPYRRSALKNQQRYTFGTVFPKGWEQDSSEIRIECLLEGEGEPDLEITLRFLHVLDRQVLDAGRAEVPELTVGGERHLSWDEATEREVSVSGAGEAAPIIVPAGRQSEELRDPRGECAGWMVRSWRELAGELDVSAERIAPGLHRISIGVANSSCWDGDDRGSALRAAFCSTHTMLRTENGRFVSLTDPPDELREHAEACRNQGAWPVLVGEEGDRSTVLAAPIILEDYPRVAPESPGDLFDGSEVEQLLSLNIMALTEEEKEEMRGSDPRTREILERTESLTKEDLMRLHGTIRELRPLG